MKTKRRDRDAGITLIELLVVMVIIAMFATIVGQRLFKNVERARQTTAKAQISEFESVLDVYRLDLGHYPTNDEGLKALNTRPGNLDKWDGPYLRKDLPPDPWGHPYVYRFPGQHGEYDLYSLGADAQEGGEGEAADIGNWK
jgi:general secretion pathway protein G